MRKVIKFRPHIFLVFSCIFIFIGCNNDELNEDLPDEEVIENITGASIGKYQQLSLDEVTGFVDEIELNKPLKDGSDMATLNTDSDFLVGLDASSLAFEQVEGAALKIPTIKARLKYPEVSSKIFVVKVKDSTLAFLMNIVEDNSITDEHFSGIVGITDLSGNFVNGYRLKNGEFVTQFMVAKKQQQKDSIDTSKNTLSFTIRTDPKKKWMSGTIQLAEVSVYAPEEPSNSGGGSYGGLSVRGGNYFGGYSFGFSFGAPSGGGSGSSSSGGSSGSGKGGAINVFPCDDPLHGCDNDFIEDSVEEEDKIIDELTGKAKCVYEKMVAGNNNINKILENFQDGNKPSQFNLKFQMSTTLRNETNASTATPKQSKIPNTFVIKINQHRAENVNTMLTVARTIIHEGIHARLWEFLYSRNKNLALIKNDFPGIYEYYKNYKSNWDHQQMAAHYRGSIAKGLKQFDNGQHSDAFYNALAWEGLSEVKDLNGNQDRIYTEAWKKLSPSEQKSVLDIITNHKKNGSKNCN